MSWGYAKLVPPAGRDHQDAFLDLAPPAVPCAFPVAGHHTPRLDDVSARAVVQVRRPSSPALREQRPSRCRKLLCLAQYAAAGAGLLALAWAASPWLRPAGAKRARLPPQLDVALTEVSEGGCGTELDGIEYQTKAPLYEAYPVLNATACADLCGAEEKCAVWSWGKVRHVSGLSDTCFLRAHSGSDVIMANRSVVSGTACERPRTELAAAARSRGNSEASCARQESGVSYWTSVIMYRMTPIRSVEECQEKCEAQQRCVTWSWTRGTDEPPACTLRAALPDEEPLRWASGGNIVSGLCHNNVVGASSPGRPASVAFSSGRPAAEAGTRAPRRRRSCRALTRGVAYSHRQGHRGLVRPADTHQVCRGLCMDQGWCRSWSWGPAKGDEHTRQPQGWCILLADGKPHTEKRPGFVSAMGCRAGQGSDKPAQAGSHAGREEHPDSKGLQYAAHEQANRSANASAVEPRTRSSKPRERISNATVANASEATANISDGAQSEGHQLPEDWQERLEDGSFCPEPWEGSDFQHVGDLEFADNVTSALECQWLCTSKDRCGSWTWGAERNRSFVSDRCFMKQKGTVRRVRRPGLVSGHPCVTAPRPRPAADSGQASRSLYCFALMQPNNYEVDLMKLTYGLGAGIFGCDGYLVLSSGRFQLANGLWTVDLNHSLVADIGGEFGTALNNDIFLAAWGKVVEVGEFRTFEWTLKADPDTVFFPSRLRSLLALRPFTGKDDVYLNNCEYGLHGPLEVLSRTAVVTWYKGKQACVDYFHKLCNGDCWWGEDMFMDQCFMRVLHSNRTMEKDLLVEDHCSPPPEWRSCSDSTKVAFHPFKAVTMYWACLEGAGAFRQPATEPLIAPPGRMRPPPARRRAATTTHSSPAAPTTRRIARTTTEPQAQHFLHSSPLDSIARRAGIAPKEEGIIVVKYEALAHDGKRPAPASSASSRRLRRAAP